MKKIVAILFAASILTACTPETEECTNENGEIIECTNENGEIDVEIGEGRTHRTKTRPKPAPVNKPAPAPRQAPARRR